MSTSFSKPVNDSYHILENVDTPNICPNPYV